MTIKQLLDADFGPVGRNQHPARLREMYTELIKLLLANQHQDRFMYCMFTLVYRTRKPVVFWELTTVGF